MAAERAIIHILKNDSTIQAYCGANPVRVYPFELPQTKTLPAIVVRSQADSPNPTKDGPSGLDMERVQVLIYDADFDAGTFLLEDRVRTLCDRGATGTMNGVNLESSSFEDRDTYKEQLIDKQVYTTEHIYKCLVVR